MRNGVTGNLRLGCAVAAGNPNYSFKGNPDVFDFHTCTRRRVPLTQALGPMHPATFTVRFHGHLAIDDFDNCLKAVSTAGASIENLTSHSVVLTCIKRSQLQHVGYILLNSPSSKLLTVASVTGDAQMLKSAYPQPGT